MTVEKTKNIIGKYNFMNLSYLYLYLKCYKYFILSMADFYLQYN